MSAKSRGITFGSEGEIHIQGTCLMGILNCTPDSFSDGGQYSTLDQALKRALDFQKWGADLLDIGGESSRPGAAEVSLEEELARVLPVITAIRRETDLPISIDTQKAEVARQALQAGATLINDISAARDPEMWKVAQKVPLILMHMKGKPSSMQQETTYSNLLEDLLVFFEERIKTALAQGLKKEQLIVDPGIGFGKRYEQNLLILQKIEIFQRWGIPLLVGTSRKSFIGEILGLPISERLFGTAATVAYCVLKKVSLVRVHEVYEMQQVLQVLEAIQEVGGK
jgi:dihydropteroate synthase